MAEPNVYVLIARVLSGTPLTPYDTERVIRHYERELERRKETLSRIRETLNDFAQADGVPYK